MKKIILIAVILIAAVAIGLVVLNKEDKNDDTPMYAYRDENGKIVTGTASQSTTKFKSDGDMDKIVEIEIPRLIVEEQYRDNLDKYAEVYGYEKVEHNKKKDTVKIRMTAFNYDMLLIRMGMTAINSIGSTFESEEFPYMINIGKYNEDFSEIEIFVDRQGYEADAQSSLLPYTIGEICMYYQLYTTRDNYECKVLVKDNDTNTLIHEKQYSQSNFGEENED